MKRKLLIADDEVGIRSLVRITLESDRYDILEASNGNEAIALARAESPTLLLLDVMMPDMSGFEVCRCLKDDPSTSGIKIVMLTAQAQQTDLDEGSKAGADDYFTKPFSPLSLLRKVDEVFSELES